MATKNIPAARRVELVTLTSLGKKGNPHNPKAHDRATIDASVGRFGYVEPIVLDERTGLIISGHGRTKTLADMEARGEAPPEGIDVDDKGNWLVPVVRGWSSRTDTEASAALIALNRSTELGGWDDETLLELLEDLEDMEDGLRGVGFTEDDVAALQALTESIDPTVRDLDDLYETVGDPTEEDRLETVRIFLTPDTAARLRETLGPEAAGHERIILGWLK